jgi:hypothetical protein
LFNTSLTLVHWLDGWRIPNIVKKTIMRILPILLIVMGAMNVHAQIDLPEWSPRTTIEQRVGYTNFTLEYGRPAARGRVVMGDVVKFGQVWRTGASRGTTIAFDKDVTIASKVVRAGTYALVTIPDRQQWTILLNSDTSKSYGDPSEYDTKTEILRFTAPAKKAAAFTESLAITIDIVKSDAVVSIAWENTQVPFTIMTGADEMALKNIDAAIKANPSNHEVFGRAAFYYSMNQKDPAKTLEFINKALSLKQEFWYYEQKISLLERSKKYDDARKVATEAIGYLKKEKPEEWELLVSTLETRLKGFPK